MNKIFFEKVKFKNFLSFGNNWQEFNYNDGINLIQGFDEDTGKSNGSGKSSFIELIPFALYGKTFKDINKNDIINWYNGSGCEVKLYFSINTDKYVFVRGIKPNKFKVYKNNEELPRLSSVRDFQAKIEDDILGFDFKTFKNLSYFSPNTTISIIEAKKEQKRKFLESLFDLSLYSEMLKTTNKILKKKKDDIMLIENDISNIRTNIGTLEQSIFNRNMPDVSEYENYIKQEKKRKKELESLLSDIDYNEEEFNNIKDKSDRLSSKYTDINTRKIVEKNIIQNLKKSIKDAEQKIKSTNKEKETILAEIEKLTKICDECDIDRIESDIEVCVSSLNDNKTIIDELNDHIDDITSRMRILITKKEIKENDLLEIENTDTLDNKTNCPTCKQRVDHKAITKYIEGKTRELTDIINGYNDNISEMNTEIDNIKKELSLYNKAIDELELKIKSLENDKKIYDTSIKEKEDKENILNTYLNTDDLLSEIDKNKSEMNDHLNIIRTILTDIEKINSDIQETDIKYKQLHKKKELYDRYLHKIKESEISLIERKKQLKSITTIAENIEKEHNNDKRRVTSLKEELITKEKSISVINNIIDHLEYIKISLKDENIKQYAISNILPFLNKQTNYYLRSSGFPYTVEIDGWLDVKIKGIGVNNVGYSSLSGGERKAIDIALQFSSNDIAMSQAKLSFNLMLLDEIIDSSLDNVSMLMVMDIIKVRQKKNNSSIYIVTHKDEIKECNFDGYINVKKKKGFSVIQ